MAAVTIVLRNPLQYWTTAPPVVRDQRSTIFHRQLPGYSETPLLDAPGLAAELGLAGLRIKDESSRFGLPAFKILGASWATYRRLAQLLEDPPAPEAGLGALRAAVERLGPIELVTATDGNHGRAVARMAALLGIGAHILMPAGTADARVAAIAGEGANVEVIAGTYDDAVEQAAALASETALVISDTSWPGYHEVPGWVIDGYRTIFAEVDAAEPVEPDVVVIQSGVGALAAAAVRRYREEFEPSPIIVVVEPTSAACALRSAEAGHPVVVPGPHRSIMAGLNCGTVSEVAWPDLAKGVDLFVAVEDPAAERAMRDLAGIGIVAGETGGSGLAGLRALVEEGSVELPSDATALVLVTEGATDPVNYERIVGFPPG